MRRAKLLAVVLLSGCVFDSDGRAELDEIECTEQGACWGRWAHTTVWSRVVLADSLDDAGDIDPASLWGCEPDPDVDACGTFDAQGHVACWRETLGWAVAVVPECVLEGPADWMPVGNAMAAKVYDAPQ